MFWRERVHSSPTSPVANVLAVVASTTRTSTHGYGLPHERSSCGRLHRVVVDAVELGDGAGGLGQPVHLDELAAERLDALARARRR